MKRVIDGLEGKIVVDTKTMTARLTISARGKKRGTALEAFMDAYNKDRIGRKLHLRTVVKALMIVQSTLSIELSVLPEGVMVDEGDESARVDGPERLRLV